MDAEGKFRFGVVGAGNIAAKFVDAVRRVPGCEVAAVASRDAARAQAFAQQHGVCGAYAGYEAMLMAEKPDAVYIAARTNAHADLTRLCIDHGVPVLCEKAMFTSSAEAREVLGRAREKGVFCMEAMWSRFLPAVQEMKRQLDAGRIGAPLYAEFAIGWKAPRHPGNRYHDPARGGGAAYDLLVYAYELADFFLGAPDERFTASVLRGETGVDETETVTLTWGGRDPACMATLSASIAVDLEERAVICGTQGRLTMPKPHMAEGFRLRGCDGSEEEWRDTVTVNGFVYEVAEVVRCVRAGLTESPVVPHALTIRCAEVFDVINGMNADEKGDVPR